MKLIDKIGLESNKKFLGFISVVLSGQIIYSSFEAFKGTFYNLMLEYLKINNTQLGMIFSFLGLSIFLYIPFAFINNRFPVKNILIFGLLVRFITMMIVIFFKPKFEILLIFAAIWGINDAYFWPAVVNGVNVSIVKENKALAFGLLESVRRFLELCMNALVYLIMFFSVNILFTFNAAILGYTLLIIPMIFFVLKYAPSDNLKLNQRKNSLAFKNFLKSLKNLKVWLASLSALSIYWLYIITIYTVPYMHMVFNLSLAKSAIFGLINLGAVAVLGGIFSGIVADYFFKSAIKMLFVSLILSSIVLLFVVALPANNYMFFFHVGLILIFSLVTFFAKSILLAPIAELNIDHNMSGSSMSIGSFLAYSSVFWGYALNGYLLDHLNHNHAFKIIFLIAFLVSLFGVLCSALLINFDRLKSFGLRN